MQAFHQRLAGDRRGRSVLSGVADRVAIEDAWVEGVGRRDRDAAFSAALDDIVIGAACGVVMMMPSMVGPG
jgi:hypothetical protein